MGGIGVLGPLTIDGDANALPPRERVVLAVLCVRREQPVSPDTLADAIWGEGVPATWTKSVQASIVALRRAIGVRSIETQPHGYRLVTPPDDIDAHRFERLLGRARELLILGEPDRALYLADEALNLWRGQALVDLDGWEPGRAEARRLDEQRLDAQEVRLEAALRTGRFREVLVEAQAMVRDQPLREHRWSLLALAQYQASRQADALGTIRRARAVLLNELGLDPGPDLLALEQAILRQDPSLVATAMPEPSPTCPYLGLVPYDIGDSDAFFGRETEVSECLHRLTEGDMLAVVGPSGSGKSSLLRAGVAAALEQAGRRVVVITPGAHPMDAVSALPKSGPAPVLVVDQCEEAVTLCRDAGERVQFFAALAAHVEHAPLVVALRADRLGEISAHPEFARLVERGLYLLKSMDDADLRAAIEGPARRSGLLLEPGLVDLLIRDVEGEPGALPLLSHALRQTWQRREGRTLTVAGYRASGGIRGAVAQSAEAVYEQAPPDQRVILRDLLLRLVAPSPEGDPVRARVPRRLVAADTEHEQVIEQLVRARLVTSDEDAVELAHEALARAWPRLRGWLDDDVEGQRIRRHLSAAADAWDAMGRPDSELYRGARLTRAVEWREQTSPALNQTEQVFLETGMRYADAERRTARRRRGAVMTGLAVGLAITTTLAAVAFVSQQRADQEAELARARELTNAAVVALDADPALAKLLAVSAAELGEPTVDVLSVLHRSFAADRVIDRYHWPAEHDVAFLTADLHPDGTRLVASGTFAGPNTHLEVFDFDRSEVLWSWDTGDPAVSIDVPFFSPDGEVVVAGVVWDPGPGLEQRPDGDALGAYLWDAESGDPVGRIDLGRCGGLVLGMARSSLLVQTRQDRDAPDCWAGPGAHAVELIDTASGDRRVLSEDSWGRRAAISADGRVVALTEDVESGAVTVVIDLATGERILELDPHGHQGHSAGEVVALNHDGSLLAVGFQPVAIWDVRAGELVTTFAGHGGDAWPRFAPDGETVYSIGADNTLRQWDARTGSEIAGYGAVGSGLWPSVTADGRALVADATGRRATLVDTRAAAELWSVETCDGFVWAQTLQVAGDRAALSVQCAEEDLTYVIDVAAADVVYTLPWHRAQALAISPDGTRFVRQEGEAPAGFPADGGWHGPPRVRDLASGAALAEFEHVCTWSDTGMVSDGLAECRDFPDAPFQMWSWSIAWSLDSTMIAVGASGAPLAVWEAESGSMIGSSDACAYSAQGLQFGPDGEELFLFCLDEGVISAVSTQTWEELRRTELDPDLDGRNYLAFAGYTPDGEWLIGVGGALFVGGISALHWIDPETLEIGHTLPRIHDGTLKSWAMSPDRTLLATGSSDGFVKVWDVVKRELVHEIYVGPTQVQGVAFVNDRHLAVAPEQGGVFVYTLDVGELLDIVRGSLTRDFTATECQRFNLDVCPAPGGSAHPDKVEVDIVLANRRGAHAD